MNKKKIGKSYQRQLRLSPKIRRKKKRIARKNYLKNKKKKQRFSKQKNYYQPKREVVKVPDDFSLLTNREEVLKFFNYCKSLNSESCEIVHFSFLNVNNIGNGAITILLSICGWLNDQNISVSGNYPINETARNFLERSGFLRYFRAKIKKENLNSNNAILERGHDQTEAKATAKHIRNAMKTVWGEDYRNPRLQGMLIELMANTVNHAYKKPKYQKGWYFSIDHLTEDNVVKFCFVDNGKGILDTIKIRFKDTVSKIIGELTDEVILEQAFEGKFGSRTRLSYRGRGLPVIRKNQNQNVIKNLTVIANNVLFDFEQNNAYKLSEHFAGTFYYWELDKTCEICKLK